MALQKSSKNWLAALPLVGALVLVGAVVFFLTRDWLTSLLVVLILVAAYLLWWLLQLLIDRAVAKKRTEKILDEQENSPTMLPAHVQETNAGELKAKFQEARTTLKSTLGKGYLYELPWFLLMGETGSGKTTTLRKSRIRWPLGGELQGIGGTVSCDWWFANDAVLLDTAGRFYVHEENSPVKPVWDKFLGLLKRVRPGRPIDGVVVVIPTTSILPAGRDENEALQEAQKKAKLLHQKLLELQQKLGIVFPVWVLISKCDKIRGFEETYTLLDAARQGSLFGWSNPHGLGKPFNPEWTAEIFDDVARDVDSVRAEMLRRGENPENADEIYLFPEEFRAMEPLLRVYLDRIFEGSRYEDPHLFRGVFFSSGGQDQSPLSSLVPQQNADQAAVAAAAAAAGGDIGGRPYFVYDFYTKKVFQEAGLAAPSRKASKGSGSTRRFAKVAALLLTLGVTGFLVYNLWRVNQPLIDVRNALADVPRQAREAEPFRDADDSLANAYRAVASNEEAIRGHLWFSGAGGDIKNAYASLNATARRGFEATMSGLVRSERSYASGAFDGLLENGAPFEEFPRRLTELAEKRAELAGILDRERPLREVARGIIDVYNPAPDSTARQALEEFVRDGAEEDVFATQKLALRDLRGEEDRAVSGIIQAAYSESFAAANVLTAKSDGGRPVFVHYEELRSAARTLKDSLDAIASRKSPDPGLATDAVRAIESHRTLRDLLAKEPPNAPTEQKNDESSGSSMRTGNPRLDRNKERVEKLAGAAKDAFDKASGRTEFLALEVPATPVAALIAADFPRVRTALEDAFALHKGEASVWEKGPEGLQEFFDALLKEATKELEKSGLRFPEGSKPEPALEDVTRGLLAALETWSGTPWTESSAETLEEFTKEVEPLDWIARDAGRSDEVHKLLESEAEFHAKLTEVVGDTPSTLEENLYRSGLYLLAGDFAKKRPQKPNDDPKNQVAFKAVERFLEKRYATESATIGHLIEEWAKIDFVPPNSLASSLEIIAEDEARKTLAPSAGVGDAAKASFVSAFRPRQGYSRENAEAFWKRKDSMLPMFRYLYPAADPRAFLREAEDKIKRFIDSGADAYRFLKFLESHGKTKNARALLAQFEAAGGTFDDEAMDLGPVLARIESLEKLKASDSGPESHGAEIAKFLSDMEATRPRIKNFAADQLEILEKDLRVELEKFLAWKLTDEVADFVRAWTTNAADRFPFAVDGEDLDPAVLKTLAQGEVAGFILGEGAEEGEPSLDARLRVCEGAFTKTELRAWRAAVKDVQTLVEKLRALDGGFLGGDLSYSVYFRPGKNVDSVVQKLAIYQLELPLLDGEPGDGKLGFCRWNPTKREEIWKEQTKYSFKKDAWGPTGIKLTVGLYPSDYAAEGLRGLRFDENAVKTRVREHWTTAPFDFLSADDALCEDARKARLQTRTLHLGARGDWFLLRWIAVLQKAFKGREYRHPTNSLLRGSLVRLPLRLEYKERGRKDDQGHLELVFTFWLKGKPVDIPDWSSFTTPETPAYPSDSER